MDGDDPYLRIVDPDVWTSNRCVGQRLVKRGPRVGEVVGFRYSAWRVTDVRPRAAVDFTAEEQALVARGGRPPYDLELTHLAGPMLDGEEQILVQGDGRLWPWLGERFQVCSCHGHPWPCQAYDQDVLIATLAAKARRELAGAAPGVCAGCREPIRPRQQTIVFPEPSLIVPGAPGPTFHSRRSDCWCKASDYETKLRLPAHPEATRLVSCPGVGFTHCNGLRFECTAGPACTGFHGPWKKDRGNCGTRTYHIENLHHYERPLTDCGYRGRGGYNCLGAEVGPHQPAILAPLFGQDDPKDA